MPCSTQLRARQTGRPWPVHGELELGHGDRAVTQPIVAEPLPHLGRGPSQGIHMAKDAIQAKSLKSGVPNGDRTRVPALKGLCPDR